MNDKDKLRASLAIYASSFYLDGKERNFRFYTLNHLNNKKIAFEPSS